MTGLSIEVARYVQRNAPALRAGIVDYPALLRAGLPQLDFYDSRAHRYAISSPELVHKIRLRAAALKARGLNRGDRVLLVSANDENYLTTLLGASTLGAIPCAVAPTTVSRPVNSADDGCPWAIVELLDPTVVVAQSEVAARIRHRNVVEFETLTAVDPLAWSEMSPAVPDDVHHIQLTSGSTSAPKAVVLTHRNVVHNIASFAAGTGGLRGCERVFNWLPLCHDMGFIQVLTALVCGMRIGLMTPWGFLRDPLSWLRQMTHHGSTFTAGPPFAYRAAVEALARAENTSGIDLSALRCAYIGAEQIPHSTVRQFTESFAPFGLRPDAMVPCYGMAETVVATTVAQGPAVVGERSFGRIRLLDITDENAEIAQSVVSCGKVLDGLRLRILGEDGRVLPENVVGDIQVSGASVMLGYRRATGELERPAHGWHETGDRGLLVDGELFVTGRRKEMVIIRGRNFPPYDIERTIDAVPGVDAGLSVVFSIFDDSLGRESVVAVVATSIPAPGHDLLCTEVAVAVRAAFGISFDDIVPVPGRIVPRTTSGKRRRLQVRDRYRNGLLTAG